MLDGFTVQYCYPSISSLPGNLLDLDLDNNRQLLTDIAAMKYARLGYGHDVADSWLLSSG